MAITAVFKTSEGTIKAKLFDQDAPETVKNFVGLAEGTKEWNSRSKKGDKLYDGTIFHRVIPEFMIQGGDPEGNGMGGPGYKFADETKGSPHSFQAAGQAGDGECGAEHEWLAVLHHGDGHELADRQAYDLRRGDRGIRHRGEDQQSATRCDGPAEKAGGSGERDDRAVVVSRMLIKKRTRSEERALSVVRMGYATPMTVQSSLTASADLLSAACSSGVSLISMICSRPLAPSLHGTPT